MLAAGVLVVGGIAIAATSGGTGGRATASNPVPSSAVASARQSGHELTGPKPGSHPSSQASSSPVSGTPGTATVPILMYHVINPPLQDSPFPGLYVPAPEFAAQMNALNAAGGTP